ncbi:hypothetical protein JCM1841_003200 [Sporobolomyces salmonicolor]
MPRGLKEYHEFYTTESVKLREDHPHLGGKSVQKRVHALWKASPGAFLRVSATLALTMDSGWCQQKKKKGGSE